MIHRRSLLTATVVFFGASAVCGVAVAAPKAQHHNGAELLGAKIKTNGRHTVQQRGDHAVSIDVKGGKVAGLHVTHGKKGDVPVTKYKTTKKMAQADGLQYASLRLAQAQDLGTVYIGYGYIDADGYEQIYWFPYDMILDGDTGAIQYVPVY